MNVQMEFSVPTIKELYELAAYGISVLQNEFDKTADSSKQIHLKERIQCLNEFKNKCETDSLLQGFINSKVVQRALIPTPVKKNKPKAAPVFEDPNTPKPEAIPFYVPKVDSTRTPNFPIIPKITEPPKSIPEQKPVVITEVNNPGAVSEYIPPSQEQPTIQEEPVSNTSNKEVVDMVAAIAGIEGTSIIMGEDF